MGMSKHYRVGIYLPSLFTAGSSLSDLPSSVQPAERYTAIPAPPSLHQQAPLLPPTCKVFYGLPESTPSQAPKRAVAPTSQPDASISLFGPAIIFFPLADNSFSPLALLPFPASFPQPEHLPFLPPLFHHLFPTTTNDIKRATEALGAARGSVLPFFW